MRATPITGAPPALASELAFAGVARQAELVRSGGASAREVVEACLARIEEMDPVLNAFRVVMGEAALEEADRIDARGHANDTRPLLGVPVSIKDNVDVAGQATARGTRAREPVTDDAPVVRRLRAAGAVVIGKTHLPELAAWPFTESKTWGYTRNPWDPSRSSGGSSGGAGVAVAAGMAGASLGSDGGGSIRVPAAACGVFGLKPQRNRIAGVESSWHALDTLGPLTRSVEDAAVFCDAVMQEPIRLVEAARTPPHSLRIAWTLDGPLPADPTPDVRRALEETAGVLAGAGHRVERTRLRHGAAGLGFAPRYMAGVAAEAALLPDTRELERRTRGLVRMGRLAQPTVGLALRFEPRLRAHMNRVFENADVLLMPVAPGPPPPLGQFEGHGALRTMTAIARQWPVYTPIWNLTGQPAASIPAGFDSAGLPLAVQIVARADDEATLVSLAAQLEHERPWAAAFPPVP